MHHAVLAGGNAVDFLEGPSHMRLIGKAGEDGGFHRLLAFPQQPGGLIGSCLHAPRTGRQAERPRELPDQNEYRKPHLLGHLADLHHLRHRIGEKPARRSHAIVDGADVPVGRPVGVNAPMEVPHEAAQVARCGGEALGAAMQLQKEGADGKARLDRP